MPRSFKQSTPYKVRKTLAETLIISNLRYCIPVYSQLPKYLMRRLQRTQNTAAGYVFGRYSKESDFITALGWLPVQKMMELATVKCTFSAFKRSEMTEISSDKALRNKTHNTS